MQVVVLTDESLKEELLSNTSSIPEVIIWIENIAQLHQHANADVVIDLLFEKKHTPVLQSLTAELVIINSVENTLAETDSSFLRINGWLTFLKSSLIEASSITDYNKAKAEEIFFLFNKKLEWLPDEVGFITPRVMSMIINEAFISLKEGISTNYPYGPFEWAEKIGIKKIKSLLEKLNLKQERYQPFIS
jgi:3-hydroxybutyryl-CoA dehydrogenase